MVMLLKLLTIMDGVPDFGVEMTLIGMWAAFEGSIDADHNGACPCRVALPQPKMPNMVRT